MTPLIDSEYEHDFDLAMDLEWLAKAFHGLSGREIDILQMRYGLQGNEVMSLKEIGQQLGITAERIRQLEIRALEKLRVWAGVKGETSNG